MSLFSGQTLYDRWIYQLFNILFGCLPIIWFGIYDKELPYSIIEKGKQYYVSGMINKYFNSKIYWKWVIYGIAQAMIICYFCYFANASAINKTGYVQDLWSVGKIK